MKQKKTKADTSHLSLAFLIAVPKCLTETAQERERGPFYSECRHFQTTIVGPPRRGAVVMLTSMMVGTCEGGGCLPYDGQETEME